VGSYRRKLEELAALGVDLTLVTPPYWRTGSQRAAREPGYDQGYRIVEEDPVFNGNFHLHFYRGLPRLLAELRPDLVHIDEEPYDYVTFHALRAAAAAGAKTLFFTWQNLERRYPPPFGWFERYVLARVHGAIAGNQDAAEILRRKGYLRPLYVIPQFGVDPAIFFPAAQAGPEAFTDERPFRIGFSGRLVPEKGLSVLLQAAAQLSGPWELRFLGAGPHRAALEAEAAALGVQQRVRFLGAAASEEVPERLRGFDVLVNPSLTLRRGKSQWKEQFGRSLVEAMACGVPVIGSDSGEIPHVIGDAGLVAPERDAGALAACLRRVQTDAALRHDLAQRGLARALAHFTQRQIAAQTFECYRQLLGAPEPALAGV
jgi:glycosyltransferase involved in cell wall biosynthesis